MMSILRLTMVMFLVVLATGLSQSTPAAAADERCFPETGLCISGRFRMFWEEQGGLAVFGFPITAPRNEINKENGQVYLTQWFERVRFELHPENVSPYDVLLGRIGDDRLQLQGITWQNLPKATGAQSGCLWFAETGHNVCDQESGLGFKQYWQTHGLLDPRLDSYGQSLALFGLPLSEATIEINPTDGKPYLTQWFERARFEWHPEQEDPQFKVLLGLLGHEVLRAPRQIGGSVSGFLASGGDLVIWSQLDSANRTTLYMYNVNTSVRITSETSEGSKTGLATDGQFVVWVEVRSGARARIQLYDHASSQERTLLTASALDEQFGQLAIANGVVYFERDSSTQRGLYRIDINSTAQSLVSQSGRNPVAKDGYLLWTETSSTGTGFDVRTTHRLLLRTLNGTRPDVQIGQIDDQNGFSRYDVWGTKVVWAGFGSTVSVYDVSTDRTLSIGSNAFRPAIMGQVLLWAAPTPSGQWSYMYQELSTGQPTVITNDGASWNFVGVGGSGITYTRLNVQGGEGVYFQQLP